MANGEGIQCKHHDRHPLPWRREGKLPGIPPAFDLLDLCLAYIEYASSPSVPVDDLLRNLDVSRTTLYRHFRRFHSWCEREGKSPLKFAVEYASAAGGY